jgi:hypothetical protein
MTDTDIGDERRLASWDDSLPEPPEHDDDAGEGADQPEPEEVPDAVLHE